MEFKIAMRSKQLCKLNFLIVIINFYCVLLKSIQVMVRLYSFPIFFMFGKNVVISAER